MLDASVLAALCAICLLLVPSAHADAAAQESHCKFLSSSNVCSWTGACGSGPTGCQNKCVASYEVADTYDVLVDRAYTTDGQFYLTCAQLSYYIETLLLTTTQRRRLLAENPFLSDAELDSISTRPHVSRSRHLVSVEDPQAAAGTTPASSELPERSRNACIPNDTLSAPEVQDLLRTEASRINTLSLLQSQGQEIPADLARLAADFAGLPNTMLMFANFFAAPAELAAFFAGNCATRVLNKTDAEFYQDFADIDDADPDRAMEMCVDTKGSYDAFRREYFNVYKAQCNPPFGATPTCFPTIAYETMISTTECAAAAAKLYKVADAAPLFTVATTVKSLHDTCKNFTTEAECGAFAGEDVLVAIDEAHSLIPKTFGQAEGLPPWEAGAPADSGSLGNGTNVQGFQDNAAGTLAVAAGAFAAAAAAAALLW